MPRGAAGALPCTELMVIMFQPYKCAEIVACEGWEEPYRSESCPLGVQTGKPSPSKGQPLVLGPTVGS